MATSQQPASARIGVDLGGTKIEAVALDESGAILARERVATPPGYHETVRAIAQLVRGIESKLNITATVGIGIPGVVTPHTGLVKNANSTWLIGKPLQADLEKELARPIRVMNDANCFALSEAADGAAAGASSVFGVILGTGVGGGIVIDGKVLDGVNLIAGEWGHNPLPWMREDEFPGPECYCGKKGCIEMFLSGPAFEREFAARSGRRMPARDIVHAALNGDATARVELTMYHDRLARALSSVINLLDPEVIVLGGGMSNTPGLAAAVVDLLPTYVFSDAVETRLVGNKHGDSSGVRGAAWLWPLKT
ncbi:MAG TPA: ROK family protein [Gemmatimonadaceae bacterium]|nr:ROK family protein [Gemmatimonadaceae bacterium]